MNDDNKFIEPAFKIETITAQQKPKKNFSKSDLKKLLERPRSKEDVDFVEWRNWLLVNLIYDMGARVGSVLEIQLRDVDLAKQSIYLRHTKNKALAHMKLSTPCVKALREYINDWHDKEELDAYLFFNIDGTQMKYSAIAHSFTAYCKRRGVAQHNLHGIRHSFATELAEYTNGDMIKVQKALGHSSINMAREYVNMADIDMGNWDDKSPLARANEEKRGRPNRVISKKR
jgi:integrase/recombinase XerD